jgi:hypothetical protein
MVIDCLLVRKERLGYPREGFGGNNFVAKDAV